jgi:hypothetical protein
MKMRKEEVLLDGSDSSACPVETSIHMTLIYVHKFMHNLSANQLTD